jgi:hypothetical protein
MLNFPSFFNAQVGGYEIEQSLRFDGSSYLSRTPSTAGNRNTWTSSYWIKKAPAETASAMHTWSSTQFSAASFNGGSTSTFTGGTNTATVFNTTAKYRDSSAWMHIVVRYDTTQTGGNKYRIYINGEEYTGPWLTDARSSLGTGSMNNTVLHYIGNSAIHGGTTFAFQGYMAEFHHIDGTSLDESNFGEFDDSGVWRPINVSGLTYGTNGFYLKFDPSATNGVGHDHSGNGNNWTATGFSVSNGSYIQDCSTVSGNTSQSFGRAFDGDLATQSASTNFSGEVWTWTPSGGYAYSSSVEVYGGEAAFDQARINNDSYVAMNGGWKTIKTGSGTITKLDVRDSRGNAAATIGAIRIDGTILIDNLFQDVMSDTPTTNWCTLNPLLNQGGSFAEGNLVFTGVGTSYQGSRGTIAIPSSGKWYWETTATTHTTTASNWTSIGMATAAVPLTSFAGEVTGSVFYGDRNDANSLISNDTSVVDQGTTTNFSQGDILQCAYDADTGKFWFGKNNSWWDSSVGTTGNPSAGTNQTLTAAAREYFPFVQTNRTHVITTNFGQRDFAYTPPTGFKPLNTSNLTAPTVKDGSKYFDTKLYTGTDAALSVNYDFGPDFVWIKSRSHASDHSLYDIVRGTNLQLRSNSTIAELNDTNGFNSFDTDGFTLGVDGGDNINAASRTYAAWAWDAGGTGSSNTDGSITSTVSVNPSAGFSIATYSANNTAGATFGHGLGVAPSMVIIKKRNAAERWVVYHQSISNQYIYLNETFAGETANAALRFGNDSSVVAPSSTLVTIGTSNDVNGASGTYVAYCFAEVESYSKFGSYIGNGSTDGPFVYCGFRPAWVLIKNSNSATDWHLFDTARDPSNEVTQALYPDTSGSEDTLTNNEIDILSNGFKLRSAGGSTNGSGNTLIFAAFSENPFGGSGVSPATAR